jgi:ribosomal protein L40E
VESNYCSKCGAESPQDAGFCSKCGTALIDPRTTEEPSSQAPVEPTPEPDTPDERSQSTVDDVGVDDQSSVAPPIVTSSPQSQKKPGTAALILSALGFLTGITAIIGIILGFSARAKAKRSGQSTSNSVAAIVIGASALVFFLIIGIVSVGSEDSKTDTTATVVDESDTESNVKDSDTEPGVEDVDPAPTTPPAAVTYEDIIVGDTTTSEICGTYSELIEKNDGVISRRTKFLDKDWNPYKAASYVNKNDWVNDEPVAKFESQWEKVATTALNSVSGGQADQVKSIEGYLDASLKECKLQEQHQDQNESMSRINRNQSRVAALAASKPWYPKGFKEWFLDDNIAYKYNGKNSCDNRSGYCWGYTVISQFGCPSGIYVEGNVEQNGTIVGYSNDRLGSLPSDTKARMQLNYYGGSGTKQMRLIEMNCR